MPMFGGALVLILGALTFGGGYGWGTWKTVFTQASSRASAYGGALTALAVVVLLLVAAVFLVHFTLAVLVAGLAVIADLLPGTAAGSLAGAVGAPAFADDGMPGVLTTLGGGPAALLLAGYLVTFAVVAGVLTVRRDVA